MTKDEVLSKAGYFEIQCNPIEVISTLLDYIKEQPEIVLCKDCKWFNAAVYLCEHEDMKNYDCEEEERFFTIGDFYCKYGERE